MDTAQAYSGNAFEILKLFQDIYLKKLVIFDTSSALDKTKEIVASTQTLFKGHFYIQGHGMKLFTAPSMILAFLIHDWQWTYK